MEHFAEEAVSMLVSPWLLEASEPGHPKHSHVAWPVAEESGCFQFSCHVSSWHTEVAPSLSDNSFVDICIHMLVFSSLLSTPYT